MSAFIVFEGGDASGKSTQASVLADAIGAVLTREPGGTEIGARIRAILLDRSTEGLTGRAEALLMLADRAQHAEQLVKPSLAAGRHVISDRHSGSFIAYQGYGRQLPIDEVTLLTNWATAGLRPDLVILLEVSAESAGSRRHHSEFDRLDAEDDAFHRRVAEGFRALAAGDPDHWVTLDGSGSIESVAERVRATVRDRLGI